MAAIRLLLERAWERRKAEPVSPPAPSGSSSLIDEIAARRRARP